MGGNPCLQGTWVHPRVAVHLGQWLSVEFQVWVTGIVDDWREMQMLLRQEPADWPSDSRTSFSSKSTGCTAGRGAVGA